MKQFTEEELILFIRFSRICKNLDITAVPENIDKVMLEVARMSPTETLQEMIADNKENTASPTKEIVEIVMKELKTRGEIECIQI
ncbi:hypothetical protein [Psychrobacillus sp. BM2]|uniref:hypothetical protein n=1 Tax=Psychrobacillus sp. BM2 TaxID=3400421 RepID=UPI003B017890